MRYCPKPPFFLSKFKEAPDKGFSMDPPIFIHGVLLLLVTTQYPSRNNEVTSHLTRIQPLEVWADKYALQCKSPQKLMFLENINMDSQQILFQQKPLCQSIKIPWKKQGVTMRFAKLFNISCKTLKNVSLYVNSASNWPISAPSEHYKLSYPQTVLYLWDYK